MPPLSVLYDGWPLIRQPDSPAALHLLALLAHRPPEVQASLALPDEPPPWLDEITGVHSHTHLMASSTLGHLAWEQRSLPSLADRLGAHLVHLTGSYPSLGGRPINVVSPTAGAPGAHRPQGFTERWRTSLGAGGMARLVGLLWPQDLPLPGGSTPVHVLPPCVHPDFAPAPSAARVPASDVALPETYILSHGPFDRQAVQRLLAAWSWATRSIGEHYPLVVLAGDQVTRKELALALGAYDLRDYVHVLPPVPSVAVPAIYQRCASLFHPAAMAPWGGPVRHALACGKPVVTIEGSLVEAVVGPAAFVLPENDTRGLGAALITTIVEEQVAEHLSQEGLKRAHSWRSPAFGGALLRVYRTLTNRSP